MLKPKTDRELLQGTWGALEVWGQGQALPPDGVRATFFEDEFNLRLGNQAIIPSTYRLDPTKDPKEIDFSRGPGDLLLGIYRLDGDRLQVCMNMNGPDRPTDFAKTTDQRLFIYEFRRLQTAP
jgi:uncharacterized protein (TIGR03067 family)